MRGRKSSSFIFLQVTKPQTDKNCGRSIDYQVKDYEIMLRTDILPHKGMN